MEQCGKCTPPAAGGDAPIRRAGPHEGKLTERMKEYVVERLASFDAPAVIVKSLKEEFGITITRATIAQYDPTRGRRPAKKWRERFFAARQALLEGSVLRPAARKGVRLRWLENMAVDAMTQGEYALADRLLGSIAREVGDRRAGEGEGRATEGETPPITDRDRALALAAFVARLQAEQAHAIANGEEEAMPLLGMIAEPAP